MAKREIPPFSADRLKLFWEKVDKTSPFGPNGDCWRWLGGVSNGYGSMGWTNKDRIITFLAHRLSYFIETGTQPGEHCCHRCDNPRCVNPAHLISANAAFNVADREAKGRGGADKRRGSNNGRYTMPERTCRGAAWHKARPPEVREKTKEAIRKHHREHPEMLRGVNNPRAKLTEDAVREIRRAYAAREASSIKLAARFGVSKPVILGIIHRRLWMHVA